MSTLRSPTQSEYKPQASLTYGGPGGHAMRRYLSADGYVTVDDDDVTVDEGDVTVDDDDGTLAMCK